MKTILSSLFLLVLTSLQAQNVSAFKYVIIPQQFNDFVKEDYQLNTALKIALRKKDYEIVNENSIPLEVQINPCLATKADIQKMKSSFKNKLKVVFTDCDNKITEYEGVSQIKDFEKGYQEALKLAMNQVGKQNALNSLAKNKSDENSNKKSIQKPKSNILEITNTSNYSDGLTTIQVDKLENGVIVLSEGKKLIANLKPTLKPNVYSVILTDSKNEKYSSIGYTTDDTISFEYLDPNNKLQERVFNKVK